MRGCVACVLTLNLCVYSGGKLWWEYDLGYLWKAHIDDEIDDDGNARVTLGFCDRGRSYIRLDSRGKKAAIQDPPLFLASLQSVPVLQVTCNAAKMRDALQKVARMNERFKLEDDLNFLTRAASNRAGFGQQMLLLARKLVDGDSQDEDNETDLICVLRMARGEEQVHKHTHTYTYTHTHTHTHTYTRT